MLTGALVGFLFAGATLDPRFLVGMGPRWEHPRPDLVAYLVSAHYFIADNWRYPVFDLPHMGYPEGGSVIYNDAIPIAALVSKIFATFTGVTFEYLGPWILMCYILQGAFVGRFAYRAGNRSTLATTALVVLTISSLIFLIRIEHIALASQFLLIWALCIYIDAAGGRLRSLAVSGLLVLALLINAYLFVMVAAILIASVITAWNNGLTTRRAALTFLQSFLLIALVLFVAGFLGPNTSSRTLSTGGYGHYSWNPATLVMPPPGYWLWSGVHIVRDATGGQYEGESYLGFGVLTLMAAVVLMARARMVSLVRRHFVLAGTLALCAAFAASNRIFVGSWLLVDIPLLPWMSHAAGLLRVGGRFIWPLVYVLTLVPALVLMRHCSPRVWLTILTIAAVVQTIDAWPVRRTVTAYSRSAEPDVIGQTRLRSWLEGHKRVWQYPSWFCGGLGRDAAGVNLRRETQIQLLAARQGLQMNSIFMGRPFKDCGREAAEARSLYMDDETLYVFSMDSVAQVPRLQTFAATPSCRALDWAVVCSAKWK